jgi:PST family polysaccharide transporter
VAQGTQFVLNLASTMVLARLLTPQDFGLVAMVATIMGFLRIFNDAGLSTATVQREGITHAQVSNLFWTNVALGGFVSVVLAVSAPAVAWFYREPRLVGVTLALCITFLLTASTVQHLALLTRQMRFKMIAVIQVGSVAASVLVGISMAWLKCGYWSLVGMQLSVAILGFVLTWSASRWRPQLPTRRSETRSLLSFGANLTASSFLWSLGRGSDGLLIGRVYGPASLGLYSRAGALLSRPVDQFMAPLEAVFVPTLSRLQAQPERYRRIVLQVYEAVTVTSFLVTGLLLALAHPLTLVVLGPKWEKAAAIFAGFTLAALYTPIGSVATWLLTSQGRGRDFLVLSSICSSVTVVAFIAGLPFGPVGVAVSYSAFCLLIALPVVYHIAGRRGPVTTRDLWFRFFTHLPLWVVVFGATCLTRTLVANFAPLTQLVICAPIGLMVGTAFICVYTPARGTALNIFDTLREWKRGRKTLPG